LYTNSSISSIAITDGKRRKKKIVLVFSKSIDKDGSWHLEKRCLERCGKPISWLLDIISEINCYLPPDWRMTRKTNDFRIQFKADVEGSLVGYSYRLDSGEFLHIVDTVFLKGFTDKPEKIIDSGGRKRIKPMSHSHKKDNPQVLVPNLYFFRPAPDNFASPLFARQYEKIKQTDGGNLTGDQYHRVHPLTRDGLDPARFLWLRWTTNGDLQLKIPDPSYHGKNFWKVPPLKGRKERAPALVYLKNYQLMMEKYAISPQPRKRSQQPYGVEYKFQLPGANRNQADELFNQVEEYLCKTDFEIFARRANGKKIVDTYFDDDSFSLHNTGLSLRVREKKGVRYITLKKRTAGDLHADINLIYKTVEETAFLADGHYQSLFKGEPVPLLPCRLLDFLVPKHGFLRAMFTVENQRRSLILRNSDSRRMELSFDRVQFHFDGKMYGPYFEIELESLDVPEADMQTLAELLSDCLPVLPSTQTKYGRGVSLYRMRQRIKRPGRKKMVIIDTDCGVDDALALVLAVRSPELDLRAVTTVSGNVHIDKVIPNVFKVFSALELKKQPPVARGAAASLNGETATAESVHGVDGLGDFLKPEITTPLDQRPAWRLLCDLARENPQQITLITIGPMTNLALAIQNDPEAVKMLKEVVAMGGVFFNAGNITAKSEFNVGFDPEAARIVVEFCRDLNRKIPYDKNGKKVQLPLPPTAADFAAVSEFRHHEEDDPDILPLTFVGLDVTHQVILRRPLLTSLLSARPGHRLLTFLKGITAKYMDFYYANEGLDGCYLHDPLAVAYVINPTLLTVKPHIVNVETRGRFSNGVIAVDDRPTSNPLRRNPEEEVIGVAEKVEKEAFEELFLTRICMD